jgi:hypothetical protein
MCIKCLFACSYLCVLCLCEFVLNFLESTVMWYPLM